MSDREESHAASSFARVKALVAEALEMAPTLRETWLERETAGDPELLAEVRSLLGYADDDRTLGGLSTEPGFAIPEITESTVPAEVGDYRIIRKIGEGGMGVVFEAEQSQPRRRVALKLIRSGAVSGLRARQRFELEAEILGRLRHPSIAEIFSAGTVEVASTAHPYFAMELVEGRALLDHANAASLDVRERLTLLARVCDGIQHAHVNGVIHRDLKPHNILVESDGHPRILDFGVARLSEPSDGNTATFQTDAGQIIGTLEYMSPEQASGDPGAVDTRTDVYALGVLAFELLSGRRPLDLSGLTIPRALQAIAESPPARLADLVPGLPADVALMVETSLHKDPALRYDSAAAFAVDLRRWLDDRPILARAPGFWYLARTFTRRNRVLVGGTLAVVLALVAGIIGVGWQAREARLARDREAAARKEAEIDADRAKVTVQFLKRDVLGAAHPDELGPEAAVKDVFLRAAERVGKSLSERPEVEIEIRDTLLHVWLGLGLMEKADEESRDLLELVKELHGEPSLPVADVLRVRAEVLEKRSRLPEALEVVRAALAMMEKLGRVRDEKYAGCANTLGWLLRESGDRSESGRWIERALEVRRQVYAGRDSEALAISLNDLAIVEQDRSRLDAAEALHREALAMRRRLHGKAHTKVAQSLNNLALLHRDLGRRKEARREFEEVIAIWKALGVSDHPNLVAVRYNLALLLESEEKVVGMRAAHEMATRVFGPKDFLYFHSGFGLGVALAKVGKFEEGLRAMRSMLETAQGVLKPGHPRIAAYHDAIARTLRFSGDAAAALPAHERALSIYRKVYGRDHPHVGNALVNLADSQRALRRFPEAESKLQEACGIARRLRGPDHILTHRYLTKLLDLYEAWERPKEAAAIRALLPDGAPAR